MRWAVGQWPHAIHKLAPILSYRKNGLAWRLAISRNQMNAIFNPHESDITRLVSSLQRVESGLSWVRKSAERSRRFIEGIESTTQMCSAFQKIVLDDRLATFIQRVTQDHADLDAGMRRHREAHILVSARLPKRGWYLNGQEPCTLSLSLAEAVRAEDWELVDQEVMRHLPEFKLNELRSWMAQEKIPDHCINRLCLFLAHHQEGRYEESTFLGVPLIDEIALHFYKGKSFTTKRGNRRKSDQSKPELAIKTSDGPELGHYCSAFVQAFGSLQEQTDRTRLDDEDYWNRHAIAHGMMQRAMGVKDSAKCLMAIGFLFFARKETENA